MLISFFKKPYLILINYNKYNFMYRAKISILFLMASMLLMLSCSKKFEDYSKNNNLPTQTPPGLILPTILNDLYVAPGGDADKYTQFIVSNYNYYGTNKYWTGSANLNY